MDRRLKYEIFYAEKYTVLFAFIRENMERNDVFSLPCTRSILINSQTFIIEFHERSAVGKILLQWHQVL